MGCHDENSPPAFEVQICYSSLMQEPQQLQLTLTLKSQGKRTWMHYPPHRMTVTTTRNIILFRGSLIPINIHFPMLLGEGWYTPKAQSRIISFPINYLQWWKGYAKRKKKTSPSSELYRKDDGCGIELSLAVCHWDRDLPLFHSYSTAPSLLSLQ